MGERKPSTADVGRDAETHQVRNEPDPFPPEGTDEKILTPGTESPRPLSEKDRRKATEAAVRRKP